jgi:3-hydroxyisobutyrate dehydrogenase-like beta-hydroxyacid dehydrogenase
MRVLGAAERTTYCGPSGCGQVAKGVNQLGMALSVAAMLETLAFGVRAGLPVETVRAAVAGDGSAGGWRRDLYTVAARVIGGGGEQLGVKFRELPYFLREAHEQGFSLPLADALYAFCDEGERVVVDDNRPAPSFWHELMARRHET